MKTRYSLLTICAVVMLFAAACKKSESLSGVADRLFRPVLRAALLAPDNSVDAQWQKIDGAVHYAVQLSRDTFKTVDATLTIDSNRYVFTGLKWSQAYQVQVKAIAADTVKNSKYSYLGSITTPKFPTIVTSPVLADVTESAIKLRWTNSGDAVTSIKVLKLDSSVVRTITLTATDIANQYYDITGLSSSTGYIVYLYSGTKIRGWNNYTTKAPLSGIIIDLRTIDLTKRTTILADTIPLIPNGATVVLKRGATYNVPVAIALSKSIKILSGSDLSVSTNAIINITGGAMYAITAASTIDYISFESVTLKGVAATNYVFNINAACNIGLISYESCTIDTFRGLNRLQTAAVVVTNLSMNNSLITNLADYGILTVSTVTVNRVDNITLTNSTIYQCQKLFVSKSNSVSMTITDNTFYATPLGGGSYYIDYNGVTISGVTLIKNNIFGVGLGTTATPAVYTVNGRRGTINETSSNNYSTSDFVLTTSTTAFGGTTAYSKLSTDLFTDPVNGNFKIKDSAYSGKSTTGDPRWR
jgi:hypothetical protein